jgi:hypothetical protein
MIASKALPLFGSGLFARMAPPVSYLATVPGKQSAGMRSVQFLLKTLWQIS